MLNFEPLSRLQYWQGGRGFNNEDACIVNLQICCFLKEDSKKNTPYIFQCCTLNPSWGSNIGLVSLFINLESKLY